MMKTNKELLKELLSIPDSKIKSTDYGGRFEDQELLKQIADRIDESLATRTEINKECGITEALGEGGKIYEVWVSRRKTATHIYFTRGFELKGQIPSTVSFEYFISIEDFINPNFSQEYRIRVKKEKLERTRQDIEKEMIRLGKLLKEEEALLKEIKEEGD